MPRSQVRILAPVYMQCSEAESASFHETHPNLISIQIFAVVYLQELVGRTHQN